jgi:hypothetical protein
MTLDALFPNLQTARLLARQTDAASSGQRDSDGADADQFASLLSDLDDRSTVSARLPAAEATTDHRVSDSEKAAAADATSNAAPQTLAFVAVPAFDMSWRPAVDAQSAPAPSDGASIDETAAPTREEAGGSRADSGANEVARRFSAPMSSPRPSTIESGRRIADSAHPDASPPARTSDAAPSLQQADKIDQAVEPRVWSSGVVSTIPSTTGASSGLSDMASQSTPAASAQASVERQSEAPLASASRPASSLRSDSTAGRSVIASAANVMMSRNLSGRASDDEKAVVATTPDPRSAPVAAVSSGLAPAAAAPQRDSSMVGATNSQTPPIEAPPSVQSAAREATGPQPVAASAVATLVAESLRVEASSRANFVHVDAIVSAPSTGEVSAEQGTDNRVSARLIGIDSEVPDSSAPTETIDIRRASRPVSGDKMSATSLGASIAQLGVSPTATPQATSVRFASPNDSPSFSTPIVMLGAGRSSAIEAPAVSELAASAPVPNDISPPLDENEATTQRQALPASASPSAETSFAPRAAAVDARLDSVASYDLDRAPVQSASSALEMQMQTQSPARSSDESAPEAPIARTSAFAPFDLRAPARPSAPASSQTNAPTPTADPAATLSSAQIDSARGENAYAPSVSSSPASAPRAAQTSSDDSALAAADRSSVAQGRRAAVALSSVDLQGDAFAAAAPRSPDVAIEERSSDSPESTPSVASNFGARSFAPFELRGDVAPSAFDLLRQARSTSVSSQSELAPSTFYAAPAPDTRGNPSDDLGGVSVAQADKTSVVAPSARIEIGPSASAVSPYETPTTLTPFDPRDPVVEAIPTSTRAYTRAASPSTEIAADIGARSTSDSAEPTVQDTSTRAAAFQSRAYGEVTTADASARRQATSFETSDRSRSDVPATSVDVDDRRSDWMATTSATSTRASSFTGGTLDRSAQVDRTARAATEAPVADTSSPSLSMLQQDAATADTAASQRNVATAATTPDSQISSERRRSTPAADVARPVAAASRTEPSPAASAAEPSVPQQVVRRSSDAGASQSAPTPASSAPADRGRARDLSFIESIDDRAPASALADHIQSDDRAPAASTGAAQIQSSSAPASGDAPRAAIVASGAAPTASAPQRDRMSAVRSSDRISANDRRASASTVAESVDPTTVATSFGDARSVEAASSSGDGSSDRRPVAATADRPAPSVDMRSATFDARDNVATPTIASAVTGDAPNVSAAPSAATVDDGAGAAAPEPIGTLAILAPATQLPTAFAELLAPQARSLIASASLAPSATVTAAPAANVGEAQRQSVAPKILTIELEPAALGAVTVKMKLAHSGIDMRISVESTEALHRLDATREKLVEAMQSSGCTIDSCTIQIGQSVADAANAQAAPDNGGAFAQSGGAEREEQSVGRQGAGYGGSGGERRQGAGGENGERGPNGEPRRVADRRGGDVYL